MAEKGLNGIFMDPLRVAFLVMMVIPFVREKETKTQDHFNIFVQEKRK